MLNELIIERITEEGALKNGENPPYFGEFVVEDIIVKLGLSVPETAEWFEMVRVSVLHMLGSLYKKIMISCKLLNINTLKIYPLCTCSYHC